MKTRGKTHVSFRELVASWSLFSCPSWVLCVLCRLVCVVFVCPKLSWIWDESQSQSGRGSFGFTHISNWGRHTNQPNSAASSSSASRLLLLFFYVFFSFLFFFGCTSLIKTQIWRPRGVFTCSSPCAAAASGSFVIFFFHVEQRNLFFSCVEISTK